MQLELHAVEFENAALSWLSSLGLVRDVTSKFWGLLAKRGSYIGRSSYLSEKLLQSECGRRVYQTRARQSLVKEKRCERNVEKRDEESTLFPGLACF